jgi:hypothetical protein
MAYSSNHTINIIENKGNNYTVHCISNSINSESGFSGIIYNECNNYYINLEIKQNFLTPYLNKSKIDYFKHFYAINNPLKDYIYLRYSDEEINDVNVKNKQIQLYTLPSIDLLENLLESRFKLIEELLEDTSHKVIDILNYTLQSKLYPYNDLVKWINNNTSNSIEILEDNQCSLNCVKINETKFKDQLKTMLNILKKIRLFLCKEINHENKNNFNFLYTNYISCSILLKVNSYITSILRLFNSIETCEPLLCHELIEMNQIFKKNDKINKISILKGLVEIVFGNIIRTEQWSKIDSIYENYLGYLNSKEVKWEVHQFMMGKGKSSIITPMLLTLIHYNYLINNNTPPKILLVVPEHLKTQTDSTIFEFEYFFGLNPTILSDSDIKLQFIKKQLNINSVILIDEFDYMYNPLQSNFNIIEKSIQIDSKLIDIIFDYVNKRITNQLVETSQPPKYSCIYELHNILLDNHIKNVNYGMSITENYRYCIPYSRKDSPLEGSKFSSLFITIVLTILYFYNKTYNKYILEEKDIVLISKNKTLFKKFSDLYNIDTIDVYFLLNTFRQCNNETHPIIPADLMLSYLKIVFKPLYVSSIVQNCSFIDIINM